MVTCIPSASKKLRPCQIIGIGRQTKVELIFQIILEHTYTHTLIVKKKLKPHYKPKSIRQLSL